MNRARSRQLLSAIVHKSMKNLSHGLFSLVLILSTAEAFGRYTVAKQHETPLLLIDDFRDRDRNAIFVERNLEPTTPEAKEVVIHHQQSSPLAGRRSIQLHQPSSSEENISGDENDKKFDLQEVEVWILLASIFGALLALVIFQVCRICKLKVYKNVGHIETQNVIENVVQDGLQTVARTKKVVVMNIHLVPCNHRRYSPMQTELTPNGAIMMQAKNCQRNLMHYNSELANPI